MIFDASLKRAQPTNLPTAIPIPPQPLPTPLYKFKMRFTSSAVTVCLLGLVALSFANASNPGSGPDAHTPGHGSDIGNRPSGKSNTSPHSPGQGKNKPASDRKADPSSKDPNGPNRH
ncbi:hypothetical protein BJ085DRAFT_38469 [Dimargaris cristalligena]|uniref:Uncharacterized protein n=1 Tax=Dimargaris cristalligena TaxID=215637 RepID=A0A4P9ZZR2_9FUNG|nr:hypothetical protein BJ085DRAFT_38469 [Dimargaris cristalligena]|eukprot:RKP39284.1 hypothetical protein BJ085DRAFT_38469 [Dimargaris cristalligena]